jgi:hypothetical protein
MLQIFDACVRAGVGGSHSEGGRASLFGAVYIDEVLSVPSENTSYGGVGQCVALGERVGNGVGEVGGRW